MTPTIQGHRGCRGLLPENTLPAFIKAIELGCEYIELDITVSGENQVLVSHDWYPSVEFCSHPNIVITKENEQEYNFYKMTHQQIKQFDCGNKKHIRFPKQQNSSTYKPLLKDLVTTLNKYSTTIIYNIEIKSEPKTDNISHPSPKKYVALLLQELQELNIVNRCVIQSFDTRPLEIINEIAPEIKLGYIVGYHEFSVNMHLLNFTPYAYVAHYSLVNKELMRQVKAKNMHLFVWTVNREEEIDKILSLHVDSIITDYPDLLLQKIKNQL